MGSGTDDDAVSQFAARARVDDAVRERHRRAAIAARALEGATVITALLAATDHAVTVHLTGRDEQLSGTVVAVGADVVELRSASSTWWLALDAITAIETTAPLFGDPADRADTTLVALATDLVDTGEEVTALLSDGTSLHGEVHGVGAALLLAQHHPGRTAVIALDHVVALGRRSAQR